MKKLYSLIVLIFFSLASNTIIAASKTYIDGQDFIKITAESRNNSDVAQLLLKDPGKIQVLYFFNYGCSACASFNPYFTKWAAKEQSDKNIVIYKLPVSFKDEWEELARLYYVMKALDPKEKLSSDIFKSIQEQQLQLWQTDKMKEYFMRNGYSAEDFDGAYKSFGVTREVENAQQLSIAYSINRTPTIVINGPKEIYKIIDNTNDTDFFNLLNYIIALESKNINANSGL